MNAMVRKLDIAGLIALILFLAYMLEPRAIDLAGDNIRPWKIERPNPRLRTFDCIPMAAAGGTCTTTAP